MNPFTGRIFAMNEWGAFVSKPIDVMLSSCRILGVLPLVKRIEIKSTIAKGVRGGSIRYMYMESETHEVH